MGKYSNDSILCDSSSLISLTDSCFVHVFYMLKQRFKGSFLIPRAVEYEAIERPLGMKSHALHAVRLKRAVNDGTLNVVDMDLREQARDIAFLANNIFFLNNRPMQLVHAGEAEVLAAARELGVNNILIDERTTRMLVEAPSAIRDHMEREFGKRINFDERNLARFQDMTRGLNLIRSTELLIMAYEHGYFGEFKELERTALGAALYNLKFAGCAVGFDEIQDFMSELK